MKRFNAGTHILVLLLCVVLGLSSCESNDDTAFVWNWDALLKTGVSFEVEGLMGSSAEALASCERPVYWSGCQKMGEALDTPRFLFIRGDANVPYAYDKTTGTFSLACRDASCTHDDCIWAKASFQIYAGEELLFFLVSKENAVYAGDAYGENLIRLYDNNTQGETISKLIWEGEYLYLIVSSDKVVSYGDAFETVSKLVRVKVDGGAEAEVLAEAPEIDFMPMNGCYLYADRKNSETMEYVYRNQTGEEAVFGVKIRPIACYSGWLYYIDFSDVEEDSADYPIYRASVAEPDVRERVSDTCAFELLFSGERLYMIEQSPFSESEESERYEQTKVYAANLNGSEKTLLMEFETDGIPDRIDELQIDGNLLFLCYRTYQEDRNAFAPDALSVVSEYALIDLSSGKRLLLQRGG